MLPENIDDLFRNKLAGHVTPPGDDVWARLQAQPATGPSAEQPTEPHPERLDELFQKGLNTHPTPPRRELWERLEDEHLRPRQRRAAAWWPLALAAAVALLLVAGGAGLWLGFPFGNKTSNMASHSPKRPQTTIQTTPENTPTAAANPTANAPQLATATPAGPSEKNLGNTPQKNTHVQATRSSNLASTASKARIFAPGQSPRHLKGTNRQPDAATDQPSLVARTTTPPALRPARPTAADEPRNNAPAVAVATQPVPAPEIVPAPLAPAPSVASAGELITVDVRSGAARPARTISSTLAEATAPDEPRRLGGRLLQQAGHLMRGERVSLAEVTGLPENVTLRATVGGRSVSKSIRL